MKARTTSLLFLFEVNVFSAKTTFLQVIPSAMTRPVHRGAVFAHTLEREAGRLFFYTHFRRFFVHIFVSPADQLT